MLHTRLRAVLCLAGLTVLAAPRAGAGSKYEILHAFTGGADGGGLYAGLAFGKDGSVYGETSGGGTYSQGTVFKLAPSPSGRWAESVLHNFSLHSDGESPMGNLAADSEGNLYGTTVIGGNDDLGTVFELSPDPRQLGSWSFNVLYESGSDVSLILDKAGNLYGPLGAGKYGEGAISELSPGSDGWTEAFLYSFCPKSSCANGVVPQAGLTWDQAGNLYGTTKWGGDYPPKCSGSEGCGVAFKLEALGDGKWRYHVLHRFAAFAGDGQLPFAGLTVDSKGNAYGTTLQGGNSGTVFELSPQQDGSWKETILYSFPNPEKNGGAPAGGVTFDNQGNLYGTASAGGDPSCNCGVVFKMTPQANGKWNYTVLHRFHGTDGVGPGYNLVFDKDFKHLYGTTVEGGSGGYGVVYEITP